MNAWLGSLVNVQLPFFSSNNFTGLVNDRFWQNFFPVPATNRLVLGGLVPDFELPVVQQGDRIRLASLWVEKPVVIAFTRIFTQHQYCPFCLPHIKDLNQQYEAFQAKGAELLLVTSTDIGQSQMVVTDLQLKMPLLSDPECKTFKKYQTGQALGAPLPAQFIITTAGRLHYKHLFSFFDHNSSASQLLAELDQLPV